MVKRVTKIELVFLLIVIAVFVMILSKYTKNRAFKALWNNRNLYILKINNEINYWKYILNYSKYFPGSKLKLEKGKLVIEYPDASESGTLENTLGIPVLLFHGVSENPKAEDITREEFLNQIVALKKAGYKAISINDFRQYLEGKLKLSPKSILISFDDGRKDSYYSADSILRALDFRAVIFVISNHSLKTNNSKYYLNKNELQNIVKSGRWDIQSHGNMDHYFISINAKGDKVHFMGHKQWLPDVQRIETNDEFIQRLTADLSESRKSIESITNKSVISFAFPYGDFGQYNQNPEEIENMVEETVFKIYPISFIQFRPEEATGYYRFTYLNNNDHQLHKRILVTKDTKVEELINTLSSGTPKGLPYVFNNPNEKWIAESSTNAVIVKNSNSILVNAPVTRNSAEAYLDGTFHWQSYSFSSIFLAKDTVQVALIGRDIDGRNFVSCVYGNNQVYLNETNNGISRVLTKYNGPFSITNNISIPLTLKINGNLVSCFREKQKLVESLIVNPLLIHGGVGYKIWGVKPGKARVEITNIHVDPE